VFEGDESWNGYLFDEIIEMQLEKSGHDLKLVKKEVREE